MKNSFAFCWSSYFYGIYLNVYLELFLKHGLITCSHFFYKFQKKGPRPKWTIYKHESDKKEKCLSVIEKICLFSVVCSASAVYSSLCRGLKYLLKVWYIILVYPYVARFLIFETLWLGNDLKVSLDKVHQDIKLCLWR